MKYLSLLVWIGASLCSIPLYAHKPSDSYLRIRCGSNRVTARWDIALKDLEFLVGLDEDQNGNITWGELKANQQRVASHAMSRLALYANEQRCALRFASLSAAKHSDGGYASLELVADQVEDVKKLGVRYSLLFNDDPTHRGLLLIEDGAQPRTVVLSPAQPSMDIDLGQHSPWRPLLEFIAEGVWHIWIGYDHILFLLALLIPVVLERRESRWVGVDKIRPALGSVLKIVSVFTIAHSITLWLAVTGIVALPSRAIEAAIALTVVVTAVNNQFPLFKIHGWVIAFLFGLVHGFGFANVLIDLGLSMGSLAIALLGFNVGVELGQMAIVLVFIPIAFLLRNTTFYRIVVLKCGSLLIAAAGLIWLIERVGNVNILGL